MSLNAPNLDDRKFQDIVDDVKRQIGLRCPEWTDHNVSDPGVTLLELFAWMMEMMLFRLNQVPEKNYLTFLEMLGIALEPPLPAKADLLYRLHQSIPDVPIPDTLNENLEARIETLRKASRRGLVASTRRTDTEEAIEFTTEADIEWTRPGLMHILAVGAHYESEENAAINNSRVFQRYTRFEIFDRERPKGPPEERSNEAGQNERGYGDALYLGFSENISRHVLMLDLKGVETRGVGMDPLNPLQRWEAYTGNGGSALASSWKTTRVLHDKIAGFDQSGTIELVLPPGMAKQNFGDREAYWVRCQYVGAKQSQSPVFTEIDAHVTGALVPAANYSVLSEEEIGISDGTPGQSFYLHYPPLLPLEDGREETIQIGTDRWKLCANFAQSSATDQHFTCDFTTGAVRFGPSIPEPNGSTRQYGAIPAKGQKIVVTSYRHGGGADGNVRETQICVDKHNIGFVREVSNPDVATGGRDMEDVERAKMRARAMLQMRNRAVTPEDFDFLALQSTPQVGRAHCLRRETIGKLSDAIEGLNAASVRLQQELDEESRKMAGDKNNARIRLGTEQIKRWNERVRSLQEAQEKGVVCVLIVPAFGANILTPSLEVVLPDDFPQLARKVTEFLDTKRLLTTKVLTLAPDYVFVSIQIKVASETYRDPQQVAYRVKESLNRLAHPLCGGEQNTGWQFGRALTIADVYARVSAVEGVALVEPPILRRTDAMGIALPTENANGTNIEILPHQLLLSARHQVRVVPLPFFGNPVEEPRNTFEA